MMRAILILAALFARCQCRIEFSERARNFSVELLYFTAQETQWHTVISPFGVWSLLTAASVGATGPTRKQLINSLILPKNENTLIQGYKTLAQSVLRPDTPDVALKTKNYIFADKNFLIKKEFINIIRKDFGAVFAKFNFKPSVEAQKIANNYIKKFRITNSNVLTSNDFENSKMILTNVITFKGFWQTPFNVSNTKVQSFYDENGKEMGKVNMMSQVGPFSFSNLDEIKASVVELPYGDSETSKYSFLIILPYPDETVSNVYNGLNNMTVKNIIDKLDYDTANDGKPSVIVSLPRFKITTNVILNRPLSFMGITDIFDPGAAEFASITDAGDIFVSAIVHKADIEVTEVGTVASAFTSALFEDRMMPVNFNANRPFLYFVIERMTRTIIFSGIYSQPSVF